MTGPNRNEGKGEVRSRASSIDSGEPSLVIAAQVSTLLDGREILSDEERAVAEAYRHAADRDRSIAARVLARRALSRAAGGAVAPADWRIRAGLNGKPEIDGESHGLFFNASHAGDAVAVVVSASGPVGVDIEPLAQEIEPFDDVLAPAERAELAALAGEARRETFLRFWTLKEAAAKAAGFGVGFDFSRMRAQLSPPAVIDSGGLTVEPLDVLLKTIEIVGLRYSLAAAQLPPRGFTVEVAS